MKIIDFKKKGNVVRFYLGKDSLKEWWGDDWDDTPYEYNAGQVYDEYVTGHSDVFFNFDNLVLEPSDGTNDSGYSKQDMNTEVFTRASLIAGTGRDESQFTDETHSDVLFYSAEWQSGNASISYFVGAKGGYIYAFMFNGAKAEPLFSDVLSILDSLTFRETF